MKKKILGCAFAAVLVGVGTAHAGSISFSDDIFTTSTNWGINPLAPLTVSQFDSSLGTLTSVDISFSASVDGTANAESQDAAPATVLLQIAADVGLDLTSLTVTDFLFAGLGGSSSQSLSAFDGAIDFGGTSGVSGIVLGGSNIGSKSTSDATDLGLFTGLGTVSFNAIATGSSMGSGAGNLVTQFATNAGATLQVTYNFDTAPPSNNIPEPATLALMGLGLAGIGYRRRKAQRAA